MTTTADRVLAAIDEAYVVAVQVRDAVRDKARSPFCVFAHAECEGQSWTAQQNAQSLITLHELVMAALTSSPEAAETTLTQATLIVEQTAEQTQRLASWASESWLGDLAAETWSVLRELVAELAYELASALVFVGKKAVQGLGGWGLLALVLGIGGAVAWKTRG